jgi:ADP-heptose:LPS heptosyltransferase
MKPFNQKKVIKLKKLNILLNFIKFFFKPKNNNNKFEINEILIFDAHLIGDLILLTPLIFFIKNKYPNSSITLVVGPWAKDIYKNFTEINNFIYCELPWVKYDKKIYRYLQLFPLINKLKKREYDICIEVRGDIRNQLLLRFARQTNIVSYSFFDMPFFIDNIVPFNQGFKHLIDFNKGICCHLGLIDNTTDYIPFLKFTQHESELYKTEIKFIGLHFGASQSLRRPNKKLLVQWINQILLIYKNEKFVVYETPEDINLSKFVFSLIQSSNCKVEYWKSNLRNFIVHLTSCKYLFCLDSAPAHIAAALKIPSTVIFGPMFSDFTKPISPIIKIINGNDLTCKKMCDQVHCTNIINRACHPMIIC